MTTSRNPINYMYHLHGQVLEVVASAMYLGVDISSVLSWNSHIDRITGNANRTLGFIRRNIRTKLPKVRETAYNTLVRPQLEYTSPIWDPSSKRKVLQIEKIQILALGQVLQRCLKNLVGDPSNRDEQMHASVSSTVLSMDLWQYPCLNTSRPIPACPDIATQWPSAKSTPQQTITNTSFVHLECSPRVAGGCTTPGRRS